MNEQPTILPVKVRSELARWACKGYELRKVRYTNQRAKWVDMYCRLKAFAGISGLIKNWNSQKPGLIAFCEVTSNTFLARLADLKREGFIYYDKNCIKINSLKTVYTSLDLHYHDKETIFELPKKLNDETQTHYWIYLAEIDHNRSCQAFVFAKKIILNPALRLWLSGYLSSRNISITEVEKDPFRMCALLQAEYLDAFVNRESEMYKWLCGNRPDINRGVKGIARQWKTKPMNVCYAKKKFNKEKIAAIQKLGVVESKWRARNNYIHIKEVNKQEKATGVIWNEKTGATSQHFCDDISPRYQFLSTPVNKILAHAA